MKKELFIILGVFLIGLSSILIPDAEAKDFVVNSECIGGDWKATITNFFGTPLQAVTVITSSTPNSYSFEEKFYVDVNGTVVIPAESNLGWAKITKGGYNDQLELTSCEYRENTTPNLNTEEPKPKIPEWIKNTMKWYVEGQISEDEIITAIQFLITQGIIKLA